jgi:hypothetical protein
MTARIYGPSQPSRPLAGREVTAELFDHRDESRIVERGERRHALIFQGPRSPVAGSGD